MKKYSGEHIRVWKLHYGKIPKDKDGRSYEIHHLDGNPDNNKIENLICVSIEEHYNIHKMQGDFGAAFLIANRIKNKPEDISEIAKNISLRQLAQGKHNFQKPDFPRSLLHNKGYIVAKDKHTGVITRVTKEEFEKNKNLVGQNYGRKQKIVHQNRGHTKGKTWNQKNKEIPSAECIHCKFIGRGSLIKRWHNENCKYRK